MFQVEQFLEEYHRVQKELQEKASSKLQEVFKVFWSLNPRIQRVIWNQYAPYFNDGGACIFSVHEPSFSNFDPKDRDEAAVRKRRRQALLARLTDEEKELLGISPTNPPGETFQEDQWLHDSWDFREDNKYGPKSLSGIDLSSIQELTNLLTSSTMEDALKATFGEDCTVTATRSGFEISTCDHD